MFKPTFNTFLQFEAHVIAIMSSVNGLPYPQRQPVMPPFCLLLENLPKMLVKYFF